VNDGTGTDVAGLGQILVEQGVVSPEGLQQAESRLQEQGGSLAKTLIDLRLATEADLVRALATTMGMPYLEVDGASVDTVAAAMLPGDIARELTALPVGFGEGDTLLVAVADPQRREAVAERVRQTTGVDVVVGLAPRRDLLQAIEHHAVADAPPDAPTPGPAAPPAAPRVTPGAPGQDAPSNGASGPALSREATRPDTPSEPLVTSEEEAAVDLDQLLVELVERGGSDLHLTAGIQPAMRVDGELVALDEYPKMTPVELQKLLYAIMTQKQREKFENELELDMSYSVPNVSRFRVNIFQQRDAVGAVMRTIPFEIKALEDLGIPEQVANLAYLPRGFVLVTGPTGSGKSTTLASMIDLVNRNRPAHIMTVEDPIEFLHSHKRSVVNQREVGTDTHGFNQALKHVLRQDPDVILVGEMRDLETIQIALTAAETGHLVFGTLHTQDAPQTIDRIIDVFPPEQQEQIRTMLAGALKGVVCQTLLKTADGNGRAAAVEIMIVTSAIQNLIREGKTHQIYSSIQAGAQHGMIQMDQSLAQLVKSGKVSYDAALEKASNVNEFNRLAGRG
jgi:twitching motility protein PilT